MPAEASDMPDARAREVIPQATSGTSEATERHIDETQRPETSKDDHVTVQQQDEPLTGQNHGQSSSTASTQIELDESEAKANQAPKEADGGPATRVISSASARIPLDQQPWSKRLLIMSALCMAVFLAALDMTIIATALPTIAQEFKISQADYTWIGSAYLLAGAAATPPWGKISDIFGRKPILLTANALFFIGSLICGASINIQMLIAGRVLQGLGGGGLLTLVNICIGDLFSMRSRGAYYGFVGGVWALAGAIGPVIGGAFTEYVTWRWCFYVNLPCDGIAFIVLMLYLNIDTPKTPLVPGLKAIDWAGLLLVVGGTIMFLFGLEDGGVSYPWNSAMVICLLVFGVFTLTVLFPLAEWKIAKYPLIPLRLFTTQSALATFATAFCHGIVFMSGSYYLPLYFQTVQGATPLLSGVYQFPFILSLSVTSTATGIIIRKTGSYRPLIWSGMFFMTIGFGLFLLLPSTLDWARIAPFQIIAGLGVGPGFQAPLIALQSSIHPKDMATGTATFAFVRQFASAISLVIGGVIFQNQMFSRFSTLRSVLDEQTTELIAGGSAGAAAGVIGKLPEHAKTVVANVYTDSLRTMWIFYVVISAVGFAASLLIRKKVLSKQHEVRKQGLEQQEKDRLEQLEVEANKKRAKSGSRNPDPEKGNGASPDSPANVPAAVAAQSEVKA